MLLRVLAQVRDGEDVVGEPRVVRDLLHGDDGARTRPRVLDDAVACGHETPRREVGVAGDGLHQSTFGIIELGLSQEPIAAREPEPVARAGELEVVLRGNERHAVARRLRAGVDAFGNDGAFRVRPLLDPRQHDDVAVAKVGHEEDLVALEAGIRPAELSGAPAGRRPDPPLLAGMTRRHVEIARSAHVVWSEHLHQRFVRPTRIRALIDPRLASDSPRVVLEGLECHPGRPVAPRREPVPRRSRGDDLRARLRSPRCSRENEGDRDHESVHGTVYDGNWTPSSAGLVVATQSYGPSSTANSVALLIAYTVPSGPTSVGVYAS